MSRLAPADTLFCYDGSLEGFFCCVFEAYHAHLRPAGICPSALAQPGLGQEVRDVATEPELAERVRAGLFRWGGRALYRKVLLAFLSDEEGRELVLLDYIDKAIEEGCGALSDAAAPCVARVDGLVRGVLNERHRMYQFLRFEEAEGGVYVATVHPRANVVPIMMRHFAERFSTQAFLIHDPVHEIAGVFDGSRAVFVRTDCLAMPERTADERRWQRLWKTFYDAAANELRYNPDLRRSWMPKRFWADLPEMRLAAEARAGGDVGTGR